MTDRATHSHKLRFKIFPPGNTQEAPTVFNETVNTCVIASLCTFNGGDTMLKVAGSNGSRVPSGDSI